MIDVTGIVDTPPLIPQLHRDGGTVERVQEVVRPTQLFFNIMWHERTLPIIINDTETIGMYFPYNKYTAPFLLIMFTGNRNFSRHWRNTSGTELREI